MSTGTNSGQLMPPVSGDSAIGPYLPSPNEISIAGYQDFHFLSRGGMGEVWRAVQQSTRRVVAVKVLHESAVSPRALTRFIREVELTARLDHPHIAKVFDSGVHRGVYFYAMELIEGDPLDQYVLRHEVNPSALLRLMLKIAHAVQHAHSRGVLHRDLKPSNVLVRANGEPVIVDFGLGFYFGEDDVDMPRVSRDGEVLGTIGFMSPEQARGDHDELDARTDVYSLGVMAYRLLVGRFPHDMTGGLPAVMRRIAEDEPEDPRKINRHIDADLARLLLKAVATEPSERYTTAAAMADDIAAYLSGDPLQARSTTVIYFLSKRIRKYRGRITIAALVIAVLVAGIVVAMARVVAERNRANAATLLAQQERGRAEMFAASSLDRLVQLNVSIGMDRVDAGDPFGGLPWLVSAIVNADDQQLHRLRVGMLLNELPTLRDMRFLKSPAGYAGTLSDGRIVVSTADGSVLTLTTAPSDELSALELRGKHSRILQSSPDGSRLLMSDEDGNYLWSVADNEVISSLAHRGAIDRVSFTLDSRSVATTSQGEVSVWDAATGELKQMISIGEDVLDLRFSADGSKLLVIWMDPAQVVGSHMVRAWTVATGQPVTPPIATSDVLVGAMLVGSERVALVSRSAGIRGALLNITAYDLDGRRIGDPLTVSVSAMTMLHATGRVAFAADRQLNVIDTLTMKIMPVGPCESTANMGLLADATGRYVLGKWADGAAQLWDVQTGEMLTPPLPHDSRVSRWAVDPDSRLLTTVSQGNVLRIWDYQRPMLKTLSVDGPLQAMAGDPSGTMLFTGSHSARVWNLTNGEPLTPELASGVTCLEGVFSPDGSRLATGHADGKIRLWSLPGGGLDHTLSIDTAFERPHSLSFSHDGKHLLAGDGSLVYVWRVDTGSRVFEPISHDGVYFVVMSPDGSAIGTMSPRADGMANVRLWRADDGSAVGAPVDVKDGQAITFSADSRQIIAITKQGGINAWTVDGRAPSDREDALVGPPVRRGAIWAVDDDTIALSTHSGARIVHLATTSEYVRVPLAGDHALVDIGFKGGVLATSTRNGRSRLWETESGQPISSWLPWHPPSHMHISGNRRYLVVGARNGSVAIHPLVPFEMPIESLRDRLATLTGRVLDEHLRLTDATPGDVQLAWERERHRLRNTNSQVKEPVTHGPSGNLH